MKPTILLVEDEAALVTLLRYNLEREGYQVFDARDGEEALISAVLRSAGSCAGRPRVGRRRLSC